MHGNQATLLTYSLRSKLIITNLYGFTYLGSGGGRAFGNRVPRGATSDKNHILQTWSKNAYLQRKQIIPGAMCPP
jgi:hypothetical protein